MDQLSDRSYMVVVDDQIFRRNRVFLRPSSIHQPDVDAEDRMSDQRPTKGATCPKGGVVSQSLRDIVSYAVICRVCPRHGMQIHIQTCTCADRYTYSYLDMSMSSAVCRWVILLGLSIGCREQQFSP